MRRLGAGRGVRTKVKGVWLAFLEDHVWWRGVYVLEPSLKARHFIYLKNVLKYS